MALLDLPTELLVNIAQRFPLPDILNFALGCKHLLNVANKFLSTQRTYQRRYEWLDLSAIRRNHRNMYNFVDFMCRNECFGYVRKVHFTSDFLDDRFRSDYSALSLVQGFDEGVCGELRSRLSALDVAFHEFNFDCGGNGAHDSPPFHEILRLAFLGVEEAAFVATMPLFTYMEELSFPNSRRRLWIELHRFFYGVASTSSQQLFTHLHTLVWDPAPRTTLCYNTGWMSLPSVRRVKIRHCTEPQDLFLTAPAPNAILTTLAGLPKSKVENVEIVDCEAFHRHGFRRFAKRVEGPCTLHFEHCRNNNNPSLMDSRLRHNNTCIIPYTDADDHEMFFKNVARAPTGAQ